MCTRLQLDAAAIEQHVTQRKHDTSLGFLGFLDLSPGFHR
jgi:hypothetical protein